MNNSIKNIAFIITLAIGVAFFTQTTTHALSLYPESEKYGQLIGTPDEATLNWWQKGRGKKWIKNQKAANAKKRIEAEKYKAKYNKHKTQAKEPLHKKIDQEIKIAFTALENGLDKLKKSKKLFFGSEQIRLLITKTEKKLYEDMQRNMNMIIDSLRIEIEKSKKLINEAKSEVEKQKENDDSTEEKKEEDDDHTFNRAF